jgi:hypothetical protein
MIFFYLGMIIYVIIAVVSIISYIRKRSVYKLILFIVAISAIIISFLGIFLFFSSIGAP